jgi:hypothetical protein
VRADDEFSRERPPRKRRTFRFFRKREADLSGEDRRAMEQFIKTRRGVEAYIEPRTLSQPLSVALVAADGEWLRFSLPEEGSFRRFAGKHAMPVYDAGLVGYPKRMRDYRRRTE